MAFLDRSELSAAATLALTNETLIWQGSNVGKTATLDRLLSELGIYRALAWSGVQVTPLTGSTSETAFVTVSIPANAMGANGTLRITSIFSHNNSAGTKTQRIRLGGISGTIFQANAPTATQSSRIQCQISNRNATNSQVSPATINVGFGSVNAATVTAAIDTTSAQDLVISGQLSNGADNMALEAYIIEILKAA